MFYPLFFCPTPFFKFFPLFSFSSFLFFPSHSSPGSGGCGEDQRGSAPRGAKDVAFPCKHLQPPGVHPGCSPVPVEHQTLYHMSGNHGNNWQAIKSRHTVVTEVLICKILFLLLRANYCCVSALLFLGFTNQSNSVKRAVMCLCLFFFYFC